MAEFLLRAVENTMMLMPLAGAVVDLAMERDPNETFHKFRDVVNAVTDLAGSDSDVRAVPPTGTLNTAPSSSRHPNIAFERAARQRRARIQREKMLNARMSQIRRSEMSGCTRVEEVADEPEAKFELPLEPPSDEAPTLVERMASPSHQEKTGSDVLKMERVISNDTSIVLSPAEPGLEKVVAPTIISATPTTAALHELDEGYTSSPCKGQGGVSAIIIAPPHQVPTPPTSYLQPEPESEPDSDFFSPIPPVTDIMEEMKEASTALSHSPQEKPLPLGPLDNPFLSQGEKEDIIDKIKEDEGLMYISEAGQLQERLNTANDTSRSVESEEECAFDFDSRASDSGYEDCLDGDEVSTPIVAPEYKGLAGNNIWIRRPLAHKI